MSDALKLMCILAHPDDESLGNGGILAKYASEGIETYLLTGTRGERGWFDDEGKYPGPEELGRIREGELRCAADVLRLRDVALLDYRDGELDEANAPEAISQIVGHVRRVRPDVVVTFDQYGIYGHPDHIAMCQYATAALVAAADPGYVEPAGAPPHRVSKLYYRMWLDSDRDAYEAAFGDLVMNINGVERRSVVWPEWAVTATIDSTEHWTTVWEAISCHCSQLPGYQKLLDLSEEYQRSLWGSTTLYRVFSLVDAPDREDDLFAGLR